MDNYFIVPTLRYKDAKAAIDWLCKAFGFEQHLVVPGENDLVDHAQLILGKAMIMLGSERSDGFGQLIKPPGYTNGINTQSAYVFVPASEIENHYQQAKSAGAEMIMELKAEDYGGHHYSCKDLEGHVWNFGSYDPWSAL